MSQPNQAIVITGPGKVVIKEVPIPSLENHPEFILVKVAAIALNPTDWKHVDYLATPGTQLGCDYSGTVLETGSAVKKSFKKGDRVAGFCHGASALHLDYGCFGNIIIAKAGLSIVIPDNVSFEEAATLGVGITTVGQALYQSLQLPLPGNGQSGKDVLIYGGSTATGSLAIQFAKLSGCRVLTTSSKSKFDYVRELGASETFDYNSASVVEDIKKATDNKLSLALDCISEGDSPRITVGSFGEAGGLYAILLPVDGEKIRELNGKVESKHTLAYTALGQDMLFAGKNVPAKPEDHTLGSQFWELARSLLAEGKVKVTKHTVNEGGPGLKGAIAGLDILRTGKVRGLKLVYTL